MGKSYFLILGVSSNATEDEIKSAYRRLAKEFHPDHYSGGNETFREIQEAYAVLGNPERRQEYEQKISSRPIGVTVRRPFYPSKPEPLVPVHEPSQIGEISPVRSFQTFSPSFDEIFDWLWSNFSGVSRQKYVKIHDLTLEVPLPREQARSGGIARVLVPARAVCPTCRGYGVIGVYECARCAGEGHMAGEVPVSISFPPGLTKDHAVMIPLGRFGIRNLHMTVVFRPTDADTL